MVRALIYTVVFFASTLAHSALLAERPQLPEYDVRLVADKPKIDGRLNEPAWFAALPIGDFQFPWFKTGAREQSLAKLAWDSDCLYIACVCQDACIAASHKKHDEPLATGDCFEIMLAPNSDRPAFYFNIEWNAAGAYVDGHRPNGADAPRVEWNSRGVVLAVSYSGTPNDDTDLDNLWTADVAIPWKNFREHLPHFPPQAGDQLRANFNRHGGLTNPQYSQWSAAGTPLPAFHVPSRFGRLILSPQVIPFSDARQ
jgi:Carbohydrate-binding family 9